MKQHPTDIVALLFGLAFAGIGASFVVDQLSDRSFNPAWFTAISCVVLGVVALAVTLLRRPPEPNPDE